jgi:hypothetical protein
LISDQHRAVGVHPFNNDSALREPHLPSHVGLAFSWQRPRHKTDCLPLSPLLGRGVSPFSLATTLKIKHMIQNISHFHHQENTPRNKRLALLRFATNYPHVFPLIYGRIGTKITFFSPALLPFPMVYLTVHDVTCMHSANMLLPLPFVSSHPPQTKHPAILHDSTFTLLLFPNLTS